MANSVTSPLKPLSSFLRALSALGGFPLRPSPRSPEWENCFAFETTRGHLVWCYVSSLLAILLPLVTFLIFAYAAGYDGIIFFIPQLDHSLNSTVNSLTSTGVFVSDIVLETFMIILQLSISVYGIYLMQQIPEALNVLIGNVNACFDVIIKDKEIVQIFHRNVMRFFIAVVPGLFAISCSFYEAYHRTPAR